MAVLDKLTECSTVDWMVWEKMTTFLILIWMLMNLISVEGVLMERNLMLDLVSLQIEHASQLETRP